MNKLLKNTLLIWEMLFPALLCAAEFQVSFEKFPYMSELPSSAVRRIFQDSEGYLWFGTADGVCRYDGYEVKTFRSDMNNPSLLTHNDIQCIAEDFEGCLWIGTRLGISLLDKKTMTVSAFREAALDGDVINALVCDNSGDMWIAASRGLFRYDITQKTLRTYWSNPSDKKTIPSNSVTNIYKSNDGTIWLMFWNGGLCRYLAEYDNFERFPNSGGVNNPFRLYQDRSGHYWLCTWGDGFYRFDPSAPEGKMYEKVPMLNTVTGKEENTFFSIVQDDKYGYLWVMSLNELFVLKETEDGSLESIDISSQLKSFSKLFSEIIKDRDDNLWIAAFGDGPIMLKFDRPSVRNYAMEMLQAKMGSSFSVIGMQNDSDNCMWLSINRYGLCLYDLKNHRLTTQYDMDIKDLPYLGTAHTIMERKNHAEYWVCTENKYIYIFKKKAAGIYLFDTIDLSSVPNLNYGTRKVLFEDKEGAVWIGLQSGSLLRVSSNTPPHAHRELSVVANIPAITAITQDALDAIWVSSAQSGLYCLEKEYDRYEQVAVYDKYTSGLNTSNIQSVCADDFAKVWIGANDGRLLAYDCKGGRFEDFSRMCGMTGEGVQNLLMDKNGCLWISTNRKITCFDILKETSVNYVVGDNLVMTSFVSGSYCLGHGGEVYFGGNRGFSAFGQAERYMGDFHKPLKVFVTDIKVHNQSVFDPNSSSVYDAAAKRLQIAPGDNNVEIEFSTLYYDSPSKLQYAYKLEGVDNEWHYTGTGRRYANYGNLEAGQYRFLMMATDVNGRWSDNIAELEIIKSPSWYKTTWFKTLCLLLLVLLLFGINRIWMNRLRLREELKIARINREKSEELTQTKLRYFTNISHELLTPLTILSCLIDDMENTRTKSKNQLEMMRFNLSRLKRLLQQILDFRKVENDAMKLSVMETDLVSFVHRIGSYNFMPLAKEKNISFDISLPDAPVVGWFDMEKMDIILFNLLSNAFKYTMANGRVRLDLKVFEQHGKRVAKISVSDTGMGIAPEHIEHIFTRFYSVDPSHSLESHGIGLTLTKELTDLHHGSITVESRQGIGSDFVVEFPLDKEAYSDAERSEIRDERGLVATRNPLEDMAENDKALESLAPQEDIHLLLVEDNEQLRTVVNRILQRTYHTYTAGNGKEALEIIRNNPIDILVSDIIMPEMNGLELCREVKDHVETSHIGVLLLTAKNAVTDWVDAYNVGADGYLSKPFELSVLMAKINSMVKNRKGKIEQFRDNTEINISSLDYASIEERFLENAIAVIESHLAEMDFDLESFSSGMNMSKSSLYRKIKSLTGLSPVEFTKNIRLKHACKMLGKRTGNVSEIAYSVGFSDPKYFTYCFKAQFKMTPTEYIRKYAEN